jgi:parallel beta-helix repeat protein
MKKNPFFYLSVILIFILTLTINCSFFHYFNEFDYKPRDGIFVSVKRGNDSNDGSAERPVKTIIIGMNKAAASNKYNVFVEEGLYNDGNGLDGSGFYGVLIDNSNDYNNITLTGGWVSLGKYYYCYQNGTTILDAQNILNHNTIDINGTLANHITNVTIDRFTLTGGNCSNGSGLYMNYANNCRIINCIIKNNTAVNRGGGIYLYFSDNCIVKDCIIESNSAVQAGGIIVYDSLNFQIINCYISNNISTNSGGGIFFTNCSAIMMNCNLESNVSLTGDGIYIGNGCSYIKISNNFIKKNGNSSNSSSIYIGSSPTSFLNITGNYFIGPSSGNPRYCLYTTSSLSLIPTYIFTNNHLEKNCYDNYYHQSGFDITDQSGLNDPSKTGALAGSSGNTVE